MRWFQLIANLKFDHKASKVMTRYIYSMGQIKLLVGVVKLYFYASFKYKGEQKEN